MGNRNLIIIVGIIIVAVGGYLLYNATQQGKQVSPPAPTTQVTTPSQPSPSPEAMEQLTVTLSEQNKSGERGSATLKEVGGKIVVSLNLTGVPVATQPAHIHTGACPKVGGVKYPLTFPVGGKSETTLDVTLTQLLAQLPLAINVHKSATEAAVYVACGDLAAK